MTPGAVAVDLACSGLEAVACDTLSVAIAVLIVGAGRYALGTFANPPGKAVIVLATSLRFGAYGRDTFTCLSAGAIVGIEAATSLFAKSREADSVVRAIEVPKAWAVTGTVRAYTVVDTVFLLLADIGLRTDGIGTRLATRAVLVHKALGAVSGPTDLAKIALSIDEARFLAQFVFTDPATQAVDVGFTALGFITFPVTLVARLPAWAVAVLETIRWCDASLFDADLRTLAVGVQSARILAAPIHAQALTKAVKVLLADVWLDAANRVATTGLTTRAVRVTVTIGGNQAVACDTKLAFAEALFGAFAWGLATSLFTNAATDAVEVAGAVCRLNALRWITLAGLKSPAVPIIDAEPKGLASTIDAHGVVLTVDVT